MKNVPLPETVPPISAALLDVTFTTFELVNASVPPVAARKLLAPVTSIVPRLLIVSAMPPNEFDPLTNQVPPLLLLNVAATMVKGTFGVELKADVPNATLPDMAPELLTMMRPLLVMTRLQ